MIAGAVEFYIDQKRLAPACFVLFLWGGSPSIGFHIVSLEHTISRFRLKASSNYLSIKVLLHIIIPHRALLPQDRVLFGGRVASAELCVNSILAIIDQKSIPPRVSPPFLGRWSFGLGAV